MKKDNGLIIGTALVFLIGGVLFLQSMTNPYAQKHEHEQSGPQPAQAGPPSVEELQKQVQPPAGESQGAIPVTPSNEKFKPRVKNPDTWPERRWWDERKTKPKGG